MSSYQSSFAACLPIMITALIKKLYEQLLLLLFVALIALAAYVSLGRQFMPAISSWRRFSEEADSPKNRATRGHWLCGWGIFGFNPVLFLSDLQLAITTALNRQRLGFLRQELQSIWADQSGRGGGCSTSL